MVRNLRPHSFAELPASGFIRLCHIFEFDPLDFPAPSDCAPVEIFGEFVLQLGIAEARHGCVERHFKINGKCESHSILPWYFVCLLTISKLSHCDNMVRLLFCAQARNLRA